MSAREELRESLLPVDRHPAPGEAEDVDRSIDAYRAEVLADAAPPCAVCEASIEWVDCPTGGWWAHHVHPADGHDALPPGVPSRAEVLREAAALVEYWHGSAPEVFSPQDSATLLRHVANGGFPKDAAY